MRGFLFRKLIVDGVNYYQLYDQVDDFEPTEEFADFANRDTKDYFYIDGDSDFEIPDPSLLNIYYDSNEGFTNILDSKLFMDIFNQFVEKYHIKIRKIKSIDEIIEKVSEKILFQDEAIEDLVRKIYLNQSFVISDLPIELKNSQKSNILFHGLSGNGKKTIVKCLQEELDIPYVNVTLNGNVREAVETICETLIKHSSSAEEASCGIVYIKDNYEELGEGLGDPSSAFNIINFLTSQKIINYKDYNIDFRTLTFVVLFDDDQNEFGFRDVQQFINCPYGICTRNLTNEEKYEVLFSSSGSIYHYEKFLNQYGKKFIIDDKCLMDLIAKISKINPSMEAINKVINAIVSYGTYNEIDDIEINKEFMDLFDSLLKQIFGNEEKESGSKKLSEKYAFEKKVDKIFNEAKKYVIGQDKHMRMFITQLLSNLNVGKDNSLYSPENYMQNILIRGCTGSGKTFIVKTVCKLLDVPFFIADATAYTEEGYVGLSPSDMFVGLYHAAGDDLEKAERGILFIDEIDKKAQDTQDHSGPTRKAVLNSLLKPAEGATIRINVGSRINEKYVDFDTSHVTFVCAGAFQGIEKIRDERIGKSKIGFGNQNSKNGNKMITKDDYITYGVPEEFMGRVSSFIELNDISKEAFVEIMKKSELSALKIKKYLLQAQGLDVEYTESFCEELAKVAIDRKQGARGIRNALEEIFSNINIQDIRASEIEKIILDGEVVHNPDKVILIKRGKQKKLEIK